MTESTPTTTPTTTTPAKDVYVNERIAQDKLAESVNVSGNKTVTMIQKVVFNTEDTANTIYRLFKASANLIPVSVKIITEAITAATADLGIYEEGIGGKVYDADALGAAVSFATAAGVGAPVNGLNALTVETYGKKVYELAGHNVGDKDAGYDIALTLKTAATKAGTAIIVADFVQG